MVEEDELIHRIADLEFRLAAYHEHLEQALEHDRKFQMHSLACLTLAHTGWLLGLIASMAAFAGYCAAFAWSDKGRERDLERLATLPQWKSRADDYR